MDNTCKVDEMEFLSTGIFELPGEPAIFINGLPTLSPGDDGLLPCKSANDPEGQRNTGFGEWLVGREVRKLFGEQLYSGKVMEFDKEMGWYRVAYEDGDYEDLEWDELAEVLLPLDITVPLKTIATKIIRSKQKSLQKPKRTGSIGGNYGKEDMKGKGKTNIGP